VTGAALVAAFLLTGCNVFGDGTLPVGSLGSQNTPGVATPGTYVSAGGPSCYWQRSNSAGIIASNFLDGPDVVTILPTDGEFRSVGCGLWTPLPSSGPEATSFGSGGYAIGIAIARGTYTASQASGCSWQQDSNFLDIPSSVISAESVTGGPVTVTFAANAVRFFSQNCGTWTQVAPPPST
jgi:hypothetical protein